jgi:hypothetical protein
MRVIDPGHIYWVPNLESPARPMWMQRFACWLAPKLVWLFGGQVVVFIKRSSDMIEHDREFPGSNTQEMIRVAIDRTKYLNGVGYCVESEDAIYYGRMMLWSYEARAWRRKQQRLNRKAPAEAELGSPNADRQSWDDVPFSEHCIEDMGTGPDGHIIVVDSKPPY